MELISRYVREQKRYTINELKDIFSFDDEEGIKRFIKNLKAYGILKSVNFSNIQTEMSELLEDDIEIVDVTTENDSCYYVFTFVGVITLGCRVIKVYPKYLLSVYEPVDELKQVLRVIEKINHSEKQIVNLFNGEDENKSFNILAVILYFLRDYYEYGLYTSTEDVIEINGEGEILWEKTINENFPLLDDNKPYYMELYTEKNIDDEMDFFKRLHECVLTDCSTMLHNSQLDALFGYNELVLTDETLRKIGDKDYILERIYKELQVQYNSRKQTLLKTLYAYISQDKKLLDEEDYLSLYGTNSFHVVWETVCSDVFGNKLKTRLDKLNMTTPLAKGYEPSDTLEMIIEKSRWQGPDTEEMESERTLTPDLINLIKIDNEDYFFIFDAKYYNIQLEKNKKLQGNPGIGDVTKQYLYQLAYKEFTNAHNISTVKNFFLMPTEKTTIIRTGTVRLLMLERLKLEKIQICQMPAKQMYDLYLNNEKLNIEKWLKDFESR